MKRLERAWVGVCLFSVLMLSGQDNTDQEVSKINLNNGTVEERIDYLISSSNNYQEYKVVKKTSLNSIKQTILDTINGLEDSLEKSNKTIDEKSKEIKDLQVNLKSTNENLEKVTNEKDSFSFLGILIGKELYSILLWGMIAVLLIGLCVVYGMFKRANAITSKTKKDFDEVEEEFESFRKSSLEREQKIKRELQDYKNKEKYENQ